MGVRIDCTNSIDKREYNTFAANTEVINGYI